MHFFSESTFDIESHVALLSVTVHLDELHHRNHSSVVSMPVASPDKGGAFDGRGADTTVSKKNKTKETNHER